MRFTVEINSHSLWKLSPCRIERHHDLLIWQDRLNSAAFFSITAASLKTTTTPPPLSTECTPWLGSIANIVQQPKYYYHAKFGAFNPNYTMFSPYGLTKGGYWSLNLCPILRASILKGEMAFCLRSLTLKSIRPPWKKILTSRYSYTKRLDDESSTSMHEHNARLDCTWCFIIGK